LKGRYLGTTIHLHKGGQAHIDFIKRLAESTTVQGHGLHVNGNIDGGPQQIIEPGKTRKITIPVEQQAGMSWYHPHLMGKTAQHVHAGLAGIYLIEDANSKNLPLPSKYGVNDIPLIVQDRTFINGVMKPYEVTVDQMMDGLREETIVVNGTVNAFHEVPKGWLRLRLLNASNARFYRFYLDRDVPLYKIATEGGFLNNPIPIKYMDMSPGERNEIMINLSEIEQVSLMEGFLPAEPENSLIFMN